MSNITESISSKWATRLQVPITRTLTTMGAKSLNMNEDNYEFTDQEGNRMTIVVMDHAMATKWNWFKNRPYRVVESDNLI